MFSTVLVKAEKNLFFFRRRPCGKGKGRIKGCKAWFRFFLPDYQEATKNKSFYWPAFTGQKRSSPRCGAGARKATVNFLVGVGGL
jgi:hypothetical protein